jgi:hypothetical protein
LPSAPGSQPRKWSKDRFSIMTTTMWSIPDVAGSGSVAAALAAALPPIHPVAPAVAAAPAPTSAAEVRNCLRERGTYL